MRAVVCNRSKTRDSELASLTVHADERSHSISGSDGARGQVQPDMSETVTHAASRVLEPAPMQSRTCALCGGLADLLYSGCQDLEYFVTGSSEFFCCSNCGFVFMQPLPLPEDLPKLYPSNYQNFDPPANPITRFLLNRFHERHSAICRRYL